MGEFCAGGSMGTPLGEAPRCLDIWYAEYLLEALLSKSPPRCNAARAFCCFGGGGGGGKASTLRSPEFGRGCEGISSPGNGGRTGMLCIVALDNDDCSEEIDSRDEARGGKPLRPEDAEEIRSFKVVA